MQRLQKILAAAGLGSRRQCEELILQGRVRVNGKIVKQLGSKADPQTQKILCDGERVQPERQKYYLFHKPRQCLCTNAPSDSLRVIDFFRSVSYRLFTIGRLDKESEGLLIVTNDGQLAQQLSHPKNKVAKVYRVTVLGRIEYETIRQLRAGIRLPEGFVMPRKIRILKVDMLSSLLEITLTEGKNRVIRKMLGRVGHPVSRLIRTQFACFKLDDLQPGKYRLLKQQDLESLRRYIGEKRNIK